VAFADLRFAMVCKYLIGLRAINRAYCGFFTSKVKMRSSFVNNFAGCMTVLKDKTWPEGALRS
jgi:hypothetical protein